uniref:Large ribosomal subunit protein uL4 n=1 Tax=uncultured Microgenomates bacterium Rifle_16ft_4_minimus_5036 TaxID=1665119 RepID=A0A0H4TU20_9BACT|nr:ribosomal protein, L4/L1 family, large subunit ribosomal protein L4 [uncultured Microgenomates bacterium Rifle_16ft_4_minimus_5036]
MKVNTYSIKGEKKGEVNLPKKYDNKGSDLLLAQAVRVYEDRLHPGLSRVKSRGEVAGSRKKIYRQKGTGGARHGAKSAPIFVGGGIVHGPMGLKRVLTLPKKMKEIALNTALAIKADENKLLVVKDLGKLSKTKDAFGFIKQTIKEMKVANSATFVFALAKKNESAAKALRNIKQVKTLPFSNLNALNVVNTQFLVIDEDALEVVKETKKVKSKSEAKIKTKKEDKQIKTKKVK